MNSKEVNHLLFCLAEEAGEVVQAACKAGRFGLDDCYDNGVNNIDKLSQEINDLLAIVELLEDRGVYFKDFAEVAPIQAKKEKVKTYMKYALHEGVSH